MWYSLGLGSEDRLHWNAARVNGSLEVVAIVVVESSLSLTRTNPCIRLVVAFRVWLDYLMVNFPWILELLKHFVFGV